MKFVRSQWPRLATALLGLLWYLQIGGGPTLNPRNTQWLLTGDWQQHWFGWLFFRQEPWSFPLGKITRLAYPVGTNIGFTDSNPLVALLLKPFDAWLPADMQFIGPWLALCFVLQGYFGAALTSIVTKSRVQQVLGGCLFVMSPVLAVRLGHDTLCAQWLLLALLYFGLRDYADARAARCGAMWSTGIVALSGAIHPYLAAMSFVLGLAGHLRMWRAGFMTVWRALTQIGATTAALLAVFGAIGFFGESGIASGGFGKYSSDLWTLFNPMGSSRLLGQMRTTAGQGEGQAFVGLGGIVLAFAGVIALRSRRPSLGAGKWIVLAASVLLGVYALSSEVTVRGHHLLSLRWLYAPVLPVAEAFRSSGRFVWPLHYLTMLFGVWGALRLFGPKRETARTALLAIAVVAQAADLKPLPAWSAPKAPRAAPVSGFALAAGRFDHLAVAPTQIPPHCGWEDAEDFVYRYELLAARLGLTFNSGILARVPVARIRAECDRMDRSLQSGTFDPRTIYAVIDPYLPMFQRAGAACGRFDGDWICVSKDSDEEFRTYVATGKTPTPR